MKNIDMTDTIGQRKPYYWLIGKADNWYVEFGDYDKKVCIETMSKA